MKVKELIAYLGRFSLEDDVGIAIVDTKKRLHHITESYDLLDEMPAILLDTTESEPLEKIAEEVCTDDSDR